MNRKDILPQSRLSKSIPDNCVTSAHDSSKPPELRPGIITKDGTWEIRNYLWYETLHCTALLIVTVYETLSLL
jgi:hypothetical protein